MNATPQNTPTVIVLPPVRGRLADSSLRKWLARGSLTRLERPVYWMSVVLDALGLNAPPDGHAALRIWGQTGDRPTVWIAGADPVYLEPRLDHLCLHALRSTQLTPEDLRTLFNHLQQVLGRGGDTGFARVGGCGYLRAEAAMASATLPAYAIDLDIPNEHLPTGDGAGEFRSLLSEVEMSLHDHAVNLERQSHGLPPINSLWIWGGGFAPEVEALVLPPLFGHDPQLKGYWYSHDAQVQPWPGNVEACVDASEGGFVAVSGEGDEDDKFLEHTLGELRRALGAGRFDRLVLLFRDGIRADLKRRDAVRFWRRDNPLLDAP